MTEQEKADLILRLEAKVIEYDENVSNSNASYWLAKASEVLSDE